ncbi:MAG: DUF3108 domain-containing protein [Pseudomonadota bacterium]
MTQAELRRLRRLLVLGLLSAALHLAVIAWMARPPARARAPAAAAQPALMVSLSAPASPAALAPSPAAETPPPLPPAPAPVEAASGAAGVATGEQAQTQSEASIQMPSVYAVQPPPPVALTYDVLEGPQQAARATPSRLLWESDGNNYTLRFENTPGADGGPSRTYTSVGKVDDGGIAPDSAQQEIDGGRTTSTRFDRETGRIEFDSGASVRLGPSGQDTASLLMQMTGMGLAEPDQFRGTLSFQVGAAGRHAIVRFDVVGLEQLEGASGILPAWHLSEQAAPGQARLEVWLAPSMKWFPVQLRSSAPNGQVTVQRLRSMAPGAPKP